VVIAMAPKAMARCQVCDMLMGGVDPTQCECCGFGSSDWCTLCNATYTVEDQIAGAFMIKGCEGILDNSEIGDVQKVCALKKVLCKTKKTFIATVIEKVKKSTSMAAKTKSASSSSSSSSKTKETAKKSQVANRASNMKLKK
jgi:hypothetical protein